MQTLGIFLAIFVCIGLIFFPKQIANGFKQGVADAEKDAGEDAKNISSRLNKWFK